MGTFWQDLRYGLRMLAKSPGFTAVALLTLALGIGANTAIFTVVNAVLLRPLPYLQPDRLVFASLKDPRGAFERGGYGVADFLAAHQQQQSFEHLAAISQAGSTFTLTSGQTPERVNGTSVTADFFTTLGVKPLLGRAFFPDEDRPGHDPVAVISYGFWQSHFASDPKAIGQRITLDGKQYAVVGVMPANFYFDPRDEIWPALQLPAAATQRQPYWLMPVGRLRPGVSRAQAQADLSAIASQVQRQFANSFYAEAVLVPMKELIVGDVRTALLALLGAVTFVLLIATVNVANLQLARAEAREREMAIRVALGAGRWRILRLMLTEGFLLAVGGGGLGLLMAFWGLDALLAINPNAIPRLKEVTVDGRVLAFTAVIALLSAMLFGIAPAIHGFGSRLNEGLKASSRGVAEHSGRKGLRSALVVLEFSLALVLLTGAGLLIRSFARLSATSPGFSPEHLVTMRISLPQVRYPSEAQITTFYDQLLDRVQNLPGVQSAAITMSLPPNLLEISNPFRLPSEPIGPGGVLNLAEEMTISPGYFRTLGVPLLKGRFFSDADRNSKEQILIINETMAKRYFENQDPVGKRIQTGDPNPNNPWETIVGVVGDVKYEGLDGKPEPTLYVPYFEAGWTAWSKDMFLVLRTPADPSQLVPAVRNAVWAMDRDLPVARVQTMDQLLSTSVTQPRFRTTLLGIFAGAALLLAAIGIYGVIAYSVGLRTHEIGVRMALGAQPRDVLRLVVAQGMLPAFLGVGIGLAGAFAFARAITSLLFGVSPADATTFAAVTALLLGVALLACWIPARRAMRIDPMVALRYE